jgi:hypothetical protein
MLQACCGVSYGECLKLYVGVIVLYSKFAFNLTLHLPVRKQLLTKEVTVI